MPNIYFPHGSMLNGSRKENWGTKWSGTPDHLLTSIDVCLHLRKEYYCKGYFRVPVPVTQNGKTAFWTSITSIGAGRPFIMNDEIDGKHFSRIASLGNGDRAVAAKYAEVILSNEEANRREGRNSPNWAVMAIHASPEKDMIPPPWEIYSQLTGANASYYNYSSKDILESYLFWSQHCLIEASK